MESASSFSIRLAGFSVVWENAPPVPLDVLILPAVTPAVLMAVIHAASVVFLEHLYQPPHLVGGEEVVDQHLAVIDDIVPVLPHKAVKVEIVRLKRQGSSGSGHKDQVSLGLELVQRPDRPPPSGSSAPWAR